MLSLLAITLIIGLSRASVQEFSKNAITNLDFMDPESQETHAELYNSQLQLRLNSPFSYNGNSVSWEAIAVSKENQESNNYPGIIIDDDEKPNKINSLGLTVTQSPNKKHTYVRLDVNFKTSDMNNIIVNVPLLKKSLEQSNVNDDQLSKWASESNVGVSAPFSIKQLIQALEYEPITINLGWLEKLLTYGMRKSEFKKPNSKIYAAHPIVVSGEILDSIVEFVKKFAKKHSYNKKNQ